MRIAVVNVVALACEVVKVVVDETTCNGLVVVRVSWRCSRASADWARERDKGAGKRKTQEKEGERGKGDHEVDERKTRRRGRAAKWKCRRKRGGLGKDVWNGLQLTHTHLKTPERQAKTKYCVSAS